MKKRTLHPLSIVLAITLALASTGLVPYVSAASPQTPGKAVSPAQPAAQAEVQLPQMVAHGSVVFQQHEHAAKISIPLYAIAASYGVDWPQQPSITPKTPLPVVRYAIPAALQNQLAAFWVNDGSNDSRSGILLLGPKGWRASQAAVGANGSVAISLENPLDPKQTLTYSDTRGGCQGCAISSIGAYFPKLRQ